MAFQLSNAPKNERLTQPLKNFRFLLHRRFAESEPSAEGVLGFANCFGLLGGDLPTLIPLTDHKTGKTTMVRGEELGLWVREMRAMSAAVQLWDLILERNLNGLRRYIEWREESVLANWPHGQIEVLASDRIRPVIFEDLQNGDLIEPAKIAVQLIVNKNLSNKSRATPRLLYNVDRKAEELHIVPTGLLVPSGWISLWQSMAAYPTENVPSVERVFRSTQSITDESSALTAARSLTIDTRN